MKLNYLLFALLCMVLFSCKKDEPDYSKDYNLDKIFLDDFPTSPEGADTWDNFVGDGPDCKILLKRGNVFLFITETQSDLSPGYQEFDEGLPYELDEPEKMHTLYLLDQDDTNSNDTMAVINFIPNDYLDQAGFTLNDDSGVKIDFQGVWR